MYQLPDATVLMFNMCAYTFVSQSTMSSTAAAAAAAADADAMACCIRLIGYPFGYCTSPSRPCFLCGINNIVVLIIPNTVQQYMCMSVL